MSHEGRVELNRQINEEAAHWFVEFRSGDIGAAGRRTFDAWMRASPEHLRAFIEIAALWRHSPAPDPQRRFSLEELTASAQPAGNVVQLDAEAINSAELRDARPSRSCSSALSPQSQGPFAGKGFRVRRIGVAAVALIASSIVIGFMLLQQETYRTAVGEQRSLRLSDGSTMTLNSRSHVRIAFTDSTRNVELLEGQAWFRVAKNPSRPFLVRAAGTLVHAIGTEFDVDKRTSGTIVTVMEGRVAVSAPAAPAGVPDASDRSIERTVFLSAGEQIAAAAGAAHVPTRTNVSYATAWMQRRVLLQSATLAEVAESFSRYSERRLVAEDHGAIPFRLSGAFSIDPDFLIQYLRERQDIQVNETATEIRIIRMGVH